MATDFIVVLSILGALTVGAALALVAVLPGRVAAAVRAALADRLDVRAALADRLDALERGDERVERALREEVARNREEVAATLKGVGDSLFRQAAEVAAKVDGRLHALQDDNAKRLEQMRQTVDEKLQGTLEKRLGESFRLVSAQLEAVQRGLGEMQSLATGVGDLRKVLSNVKIRGTWGEVQLGSLLEQLLAPDQFAQNVATRPGTGERVEFAIRLPGRGDGEAEVLLPIDAKFPVEDYQRLVEASERGDAAGVEEATRALEVRIKGCAKDIHEKYLNPPMTTDFAILFLPTEGLYAEVVRRLGLVELLQRDYKIVVAGPTTLAALLNSLQMGFRTLAIQKRSSEVWQVLGAVKTEFGKFGDVLEKVQKKLEEASNTIDAANVRRRAIEKKLTKVQELPAAEEDLLLPRLKIAELDPAD
jgi:DNA recombination protein RmuC